MQVLIDVPDRWGRVSTAEVAVRRETVEIRYQDRIVGIADRDLLRDWLAEPRGSYVYDETCWLAVSVGVALALEDEPAWVLPDHVLFRLREQIEQRRGATMGLAGMMEGEAVNGMKYRTGEKYSVLDELTDVQVGMLVFLAGRCDQPPGPVRSRGVRWVDRLGGVCCVSLFG